MDADICFLSAIEMAHAIQSGQLSARDAMEAHLQQIDRLNPALNAMVTLVPEQAMAQARLTDEAFAHGRVLGPLHGLPVAIKDLHDTAGIRTTYGSRIFENHVPEQDTIVVERLKNAGAIVIGKTNTPEFGAGSQTFNEVFGATRNPFDLTKTCGGSSGGAAVALACGMVPIADGSDMGGSLRNPASFCNVVGLRPGSGRVPNLHPDAANLSVGGPMARSVADLALMLSVIAEEGGQFTRPLERDLRGVRVAWFKDLGGVPFDGRVTRVIERQRDMFQSLGCTVETAEPDFSGADEAFKILRAWSFAVKFGELSKRRGDLMKDTVIQEIERGVALSAMQIAHAEALRTELVRRVDAFFELYEFFVLPVAQVPPFDVSQPYVAEIEGRKMETYIDWMQSCYFISMTGCPAISVPAGFTEEGLPIGLQIVGRDEWGVLQIAHAFEQAKPDSHFAPVGR